jgi:paraquat-inducible protein A
MEEKEKIWICETCDLIVKSKNSGNGAKYYCPRCKSLIFSEKENVVTTLFVLSFSALLMYYPAFFYPIMKLSSAGLSSMGSVYDSFWGFYYQGETLLALIVFTSAVLIPFLIPFFIFIVTLLNKLKIFPGVQRDFLKFFIHLKDWGMAEVYLLGIFISIIKMHSMAEIKFETGLYIYIFFTIINALIFSNFNKELIWLEVEKQLPNRKSNSTIDISNLKKTGKDSNLILCETCNEIVKNDGNEHESVCPRCFSKIHMRKPDSITKAWALLLVSMIFIIPANILPIMEVKFLGTSTFSTIMDGIIYFFHAKEYGIGAVIFIASVLVPIYKILVVLMIIINVKFKNSVYIDLKTKLFKSIEFIGKWSMLDIFVIALMTVFVDFGELSTTYAADAAIYFALVVISTMLAGHFLDIRLIWDSKSEIRRL